MGGGAFVGAALCGRPGREGCPFGAGRPHRAAPTKKRTRKRIHLAPSHPEIPRRGARRSRPEPVHPGLGARLPRERARPPRPHRADHHRRLAGGRGGRLRWSGEAHAGSGWAGQGGGLGRPRRLAVELDGAFHGLDLHGFPALAVPELGERPCGAGRAVRHPAGIPQGGGLPHGGLPHQPLAGGPVRLRPGVRRLPVPQGGQARRGAPRQAQRGAGLRLGPHPAAPRPLRAAGLADGASARCARGSAEAGQASGPGALLRSGRPPAARAGEALPGLVQAERGLCRRDARGHAGRLEAERPVGEDAPRGHRRPRRGASGKPARSPTAATSATCWSKSLWW